MKYSVLTINSSYKGTSVSHILQQHPQINEPYSQWVDRQRFGGLHSLHSFLSQNYSLSLNVVYMATQIAIDISQPQGPIVLVLLKNRFAPDTGDIGEFLLHHNIDFVAEYDVLKLAFDEAATRYRVIKIHEPESQLVYKLAIEPMIGSTFNL